MSDTTICKEEKKRNVISDVTKRNAERYDDRLNLWPAFSLNVTKVVTTITNRITVRKRPVPREKEQQLSRDPLLKQAAVQAGKRSNRKAACQESKADGITIRKSTRIGEKRALKSLRTMEL